MSEQVYNPSEPFTEVTVFEATSVPTAVVEVTDYPMDELETIFDQAFSGLFPALGEVGAEPVGPAFALYTRQPSDTVDLQIGVPLAAGLTQALDVGNGLTAVPAELPGGTIGARTYLGGFDGLGPAWGEFVNELLEAGHHPGLPFFEVYVTEPSPDMDPADLRTDLYIVLS